MLKTYHRNLLILGTLAIITGLAYNNCSHDDGGSDPAQPQVLSENYVIDTSIDNQQGWTVPAAFNEKILDVGSEAHSGKGVWFIANTIVSGAFGNQPRSPDFTKTSGESTVRSTGGGDSMEMQYYFKSVATVADGSSYTTSFSPTGGDRHDYLRLENNTDANGGLRIFAYDGAGLTPHTVVENITRGVWHHLKVVNTNPDGGGNDIVQVYLDGVLVSTHTTWEDWRTALPAATLAVSRIMFRLTIATTDVDASLTGPAQGFYIDDFSQRTFDSSAPTAYIESYSTSFEP